jgi:hypothetical protein
MSRNLLPALLGGLVSAGLWAVTAGPAAAQPAPLPPPNPVGAAPSPAPPPTPVGPAVTPAPPPTPIVPGVIGIPPAAPEPVPYRPLNNFWYYPYYYFPANYWPAMSPRWPEPVGCPYQRPPAYMAFPPFREPNWRYEYWVPQRYYRGYHFMLDIF